MQTNKNAICLLAFINKVYLVGAMLGGYIHKQYIMKNNLKIDLVLMIDKTFEKYIDEIKKIYDRVEIINLEEIKLSPDYNVHKKYSHWLKYSINKWQVLNFDEYEKILFCDTEIIPLSSKWYDDLFNLQAPAFLTKGQNDNYGTIINKNMVTNKQINSSEEYRTSSKNFTFTIDAGLVLLKPDKKLYREYLEFVRFAEGSEGYISSNISGADETTLLLFYIFYKKIECRMIPYHYAVITWENHKYQKDKIEGLNFLSYIKPWVKHQLIQWADERIWHNIAKCMFFKYEMIQIENIYFNLQIDNLYNYLNAINKKTTNSVPYNYEAYFDSKLKHQTNNFLYFLKKIKQHYYQPIKSIESSESSESNESGKLDEKQKTIIMFKILNKAKQISNHMSSKTDIDQTDVKNNICS